MAHENQLAYAQGVFVQTKLPELSNWIILIILKIKKRIYAFLFFLLFQQFINLHIKWQLYHFEMCKSCIILF